MPGEWEQPKNENRILTELWQNFNRNYEPIKLCVNHKSKLWTIVVIKNLKFWNRKKFSWKTGFVEIGAESADPRYCRGLNRSNPIHAQPIVFLLKNAQTKFIDIFSTTNFGLQYNLCITECVTCTTKLCASDNVYDWKVIKPYSHN